VDVLIGNIKTDQELLEQTVAYIIIVYSAFYTMYSIYGPWGSNQDLFLTSD